ncbi:MAG TPA: bacillithiol biosynthesis BshC, partial [Candidatus Krumholzibacteria bacterium]|nr:bacillithiol biosynthesis BshC [Candidatus Krumholzibacteria bacterium]
MKARIEVAAMPSVTPLYRDFVSRGGGRMQSRLPSFHAGDEWSAALARRVSVAPELVNTVRDYNTTLGVQPATIERLKGLADGSVRAIVTGQQPGVLGGPLLSLYKAATAVAIAREIEARHGRPCVPVFWLGADDDDFAEVRDLSVLATDYSRLDVALDASAYRPGLRVGDMNASALRAVWSAVSPSLPTGPAHDHLSAAVSAAGDFADGAARALVAATGGAILIVDARAPQLKEAGRDLLLSFYDRESELRALLEADSAALERDGYHAQVQWGQDSGLFVVEAGVRQRVPAGQRERVRAEIARDISTVAPGVIARNLLQDSVLAPLAVVLGPAEIAYRAQMTGIYRALG